MSDASLKIDRLAFGGSGFGRIDGKACFVPYTAPGDLVRVHIQKETSSYISATVTEILQPSPDRIMPVCPVFGRCGGCQWQHIAYCDQLAAKHDIFADALWRLARVGKERILLPLSSENQTGYRSRIQVKLYGRTRNFQIGFYASGSHYVVNFPDEGCAVAHPVLNQALRILRPVIEEFPERDSLPQLDLAVGSDSNVVMIIHYRGDETKRAGDFWRSRQGDLPMISGCFLQCGRKTTVTQVFGTRHLFYTVTGSVLPGVSSDLQILFSAGSFSQVNYQQNRALVTIALEWGNPKADERVLDLCCGSGNFTLPFARNVREVVGVESDEGSVSDARVNAAAIGIDSARFVLATGKSGLRDLLARGERFDLVLIDPPREGAADMIALIAEMCASRLLYVSCDPQTLGRDLAQLQKSGYRVVQSRVIDMFPQTYHIESITLLERD